MTQNRNPENRRFGTVLVGIESGLKYQRANWNGSNMFIYLVSGSLDGHEDYIAMRTADGNTIPWLASQADMLSRDWEIVE